MTSSYKNIGDYIDKVNNRNTDLKTTNLLGINIDKFFMPSVANVVGTDMSNYKVVKKGQFACNRMHVGRDYRIPVSLSDIEEDFLVSPAYDVFEVKDPDVLLPEYLMMWFSRAEYDRNAWFYTDADVRGGLHWDAFCKIGIPVPSIDKQKEIVKEYNILVDRINLNDQLINKLEETAQSIYKQWFVDFEFPDENGNPYKLNGGEMIFDEDLDIEIPKEWSSKIIENIAVIKAGGDKPDFYSYEKTNEHKVPIYSNGTTNDGLFGYTNVSKYPKNSITVSARGTIGYCSVRTEPFDAIVRLLVVMPKEHFYINYLYEALKRIGSTDSGSVQGQLTIPQLSSFIIMVPDRTVLEKYNHISSSIVKSINVCKKEVIELKKLQSLLLSKLATIEN